MPPPEFDEASGLLARIKTLRASDRRAVLARVRPETRAAVERDLRKAGPAARRTETEDDRYSRALIPFFAGDETALATLTPAARAALLAVLPGDGGEMRRSLFDVTMDSVRNLGPRG